MATSAAAWGRWAGASPLRTDETAPDTGLIREAEQTRAASQAKPAAPKPLNPFDDDVDEAEGGLDEGRALNFASFVAPAPTPLAAVAAQQVSAPPLTARTSPTRSGAAGATLLSVVPSPGGSMVHRRQPSANVLQPVKAPLSARTAAAKRPAAVPDGPPEAELLFAAAPGQSGPGPVVLAAAPAPRRPPALSQDDIFGLGQLAPPPPSQAAVTAAAVRPSARPPPPLPPRLRPGAPPSETAAQASCPAALARGVLLAMRAAGFEASAAPPALAAAGGPGCVPVTVRGGKATQELTRLALVQRLLHADAPTNPASAAAPPVAAALADGDSAGMGGSVSQGGRRAQLPGGVGGSLADSVSDWGGGGALSQGGGGGGGSTAGPADDAGSSASGGGGRGRGGTARGSASVASAASLGRAQPLPHHHRRVGSGPASVARAGSAGGSSERVSDSGGEAEADGGSSSASDAPPSAAAAAASSGNSGSGAPGDAASVAAAEGAAHPPLRPPGLLAAPAGGGMLIAAPVPDDAVSVISDSAAASVVGGRSGRPRLPELGGVGLSAAAAAATAAAASAPPSSSATAAPTPATLCTEPVWALRFSVDGRFLAAAGGGPRGAIVRLWEVCPWGEDAGAPSSSASSAAATTAARATSPAGGHRRAASQPLGDDDGNASGSHLSRHSNGGDSAAAPTPPSLSVAPAAPPAVADASAAAARRLMGLPPASGGAPPSPGASAVLGGECATDGGGGGPATAGFAGLIAAAAAAAPATHEPGAAVAAAVTAAASLGPHSLVHALAASSGGAGGGPTLPAVPAPPPLSDTASSYVAPAAAEPPPPARRRLSTQLGDDDAASVRPDAAAVAAATAASAAAAAAAIAAPVLVTHGRPFLRRLPVREWAGHSSPVVDLSWSRAGLLLSASLDRDVRLWHATQPGCLHRFTHPAAVAAVAFHPGQDTFFLTGCLDKRVRLWSLDSGRVVLWQAAPAPVTAVAFSPDARYAVAGTADGLLLVYLTDGLRFAAQAECRDAAGPWARGSKVCGIDFLPPSPSQLPGGGGGAGGAAEDGGDGEMASVLVSSNDSSVRLLRISRAAAAGPGGGGGGDGSGAGAGSAGDGTGGSAPAAFAVSVAHVFKYAGHANARMQVRASFDPAGARLVSGSDDGRVYVWRTRGDQARPRGLAAACFACLFPERRGYGELGGSRGVRRRKVYAHESFLADDGVQPPPPPPPLRLTLLGGARRRRRDGLSGRFATPCAIFAPAAALALARPLDAAVLGWLTDPLSGLPVTAPPSAAAAAPALEPLPALAPAAAAFAGSRSGMNRVTADAVTASPRVLRRRHGYTSTPTNDDVAASAAAAAAAPAPGTAAATLVRAAGRTGPTVPGAPAFASRSGGGPRGFGGGGLEGIRSESPVSDDPPHAGAGPEGSAASSDSDPGAAGAALLAEALSNHVVIVTASSRGVLRVYENCGRAVNL